MVDDLDRMAALKNALTRLSDSGDGGKIKAVTDGDKVYLVIQNAPEELRRLADALEQLNVEDISALVAYTNPARESRRIRSVDENAADS